ncbi:PAS domain S-box protein [Neopusillimonas aromaticivorans]|uniref:PAS domain S-box protein n=1 Tax=Neopusillimonas aromaticivorans TaxID=2979868 RepID=UPI0025926F52|nr:PAS domain S-box protein [Neopusillimonas aromaticivorans]WJJ92924.1 PAS domain S-box protein [Neopusillimonas aromaticivorans]
MVSPDESLFKALAENAVIGVYLICQNRFLYVNTKLAEMLGYSREEMLNDMSLFDIVAHDEKHLVGSHVTRTLSGEISEFHYERKARKQDGAYIDVEVYASAMRLGPEPVLIGMMLDITQRKADAKSAHLASWSTSTAARPWSLPMPTGLLLPLTRRLPILRVTPLTRWLASG